MGSDTADGKRSNVNKRNDRVKEILKFVVRRHLLKVYM